MANEEKHVTARGLLLASIALALVGMAGCDEHMNRPAETWCDDGQKPQFIQDASYPDKYGGAFYPYRCAK